MLEFVGQITHLLLSKSRHCFQSNDVIAHRILLFFNTRLIRDNPTSLNYDVDSGLH